MRICTLIVGMPSDTTILDKIEQDSVKLRNYSLAIIPSFSPMPGNVEKCA